MKTLSFRARIGIALCTLVFFSLFAAFVALNSALRQEIRHETKDCAIKQLDLIAWQMQERSFSDAAAYDAWITRLSEKIGSRITFIQAGRVLADSDVPYARLPELEDHSTRPEVLQALETGLGMNIRRSVTVKRDLFYVARPMDAVSGMPRGVLRVAVPLKQIQSQYTTLAWHLWWVLGSTLFVAMLLALLLSKTLVGSVRAFSRDAAAIGQGAYDQRLHFYPGREFKPLAEAFNTMADNIRRTIKEIEDGKQRLETLFNAMSDGVLALDEQGRIESWNKAMTALLPEVEHAKGKQPLEVIADPALHASLTRLMRSDTPGASEQLLVLGEKRLDVRIERGESHGQPRLLLVFRDVTEQQRLDAMRRDFVANVSHELKTPITSILGYTETLLDLPENLPPGQLEDRSENAPRGEQRREFLQTIQRNAQHMHSMVMRLIDLSKAERSVSFENLEKVGAAQALETALEVLAPMLQQNRVNLLQDPPLQGLTVRASREGLVDIFRNLLENAVKFGPKGQTVTISARREGAMVVFAVRDQGPGIPRQLCERVFERFYRGLTFLGDKDGSAGLGLSICRNLVERFGGDISADPEACPWPQDGTGACLSFTLPAAEEDRTK